MGQVEILEVLKKAKKPLAGSEIAQLVQDNDKHTFHIIRKLIKNREIKVMEIDREQALQYYKCKRRMRLYYISKD